MSNGNKRKMQSDLLEFEVRKQVILLLLRKKSLKLLSKYFLKEAI